MLAHLHGVDHAVIAVPALDEAAEAWRRLGFRVSPRGVHSAHVGSANHTIAFEADYLELLGVVTETPRNAATRAFLARGGGLERLAFRTDDAEALAQGLRAQGIAPDGPLDFGRPVDRPDGSRAEARFRTVRWPPDQAPGGLRVFACQHLTPDAVWIPALQQHPNAARRLRHVEVLTAAPRQAADHLSRLIQAPVIAEPDGAWRVPTGTRRAAILFVDAATLARRHPPSALGALPAEGAVAVSVEVADPAAAADAVGAAGIPGDQRITVPPAAASGLILELAAPLRSSPGKY